MTVSTQTTAPSVTQVEVLVDATSGPTPGSIPVRLGNEIEFSTAALQSYAFVTWKPQVFDLMLLCAAVEFCDRTVKRRATIWPRNFNITVPVHNCDQWSEPRVTEALTDALGFLTGDEWSFTFVPRKAPVVLPELEYLEFNFISEAVMAYSNGMDSLTVAKLIESDYHGKLVCVRVERALSRRGGHRKPFIAVPYRVSSKASAQESSARSRGFRFTVVAGIAAFLTRATDIVIPESGTGILGPALLGVGHAYPDYRNHPLFTYRMERFLRTVLETTATYKHPRIWSTKGETLREYITLLEARGEREQVEAWRKTRSCWRDSRWSSVKGKLKHCGVCAACLLRRVAVHSAHQTEDKGFYICGNLDAPTLRAAVDPNFTRFGRAYEQHAAAGVLFMDNLAHALTMEEQPALQQHANLLSSCMPDTVRAVEQKLRNVLRQHQKEWQSFMDTIDAASFMRSWIRPS